MQARTQEHFFTFLSFVALNGHCDSQKCQKLERSNWHLAASKDLHKLFFYCIVEIIYRNGDSLNIRLIDCGGRLQ